LRDAIILTLQFDEASDALFQDLRQRHYPPELNLVGAHLTLFHNLPSTEENAIIREVARLAKSTPPFPVVVEELMRLGRGVALKIRSERLVDLRQALAKTFKAALTGQDREAFRPHVTIQNKVAEHAASALFDHLAQTLPPFEATAEGFQLWRYGGDRWTPVAAVPFQGAPE
jgi:2'-5' RNA ligase